MKKYELILSVNDMRVFPLLKYNDHEMSRSSSETKLNDSKIEVKVVADDATALRASVDGYVKALKVFESTEKLIDA